MNNDIDLKKMKRTELENKVRELHYQVDELKKQLTYLINVLSTVDNISDIEEGEDIFFGGNWDEIIGGKSGKYSM